MKYLNNLNWFVLLAGVIGLVFLIVAQEGNLPAQFFGIGAIILAILYFLKFESVLVKELLKKGKQLRRISLYRSLKNLVRWPSKEGWFYAGTLFIVSVSFLGFGLYHLGQFMSVDEPKWLNTRVPQLYDALATREWEDTYINDKPGVLPSALAGITNFFLDKDDFTPQTFENYLFWWRFPILLFNFFTLFLIYHFTKKLLDKNYALLTTGLIALNPIIIGISQIVNPDATLWNTGFLSFLTFFLYLKSNQEKYLWYSGIFLGLALISKYFVTIFYVVFFLAVYFEYLITKVNQARFFKRIWKLGKLYLISITTYALLFPVTWVTPRQILAGTFGANILTSGQTLLLLILLVIFAELALLKGRVTAYLKRKFNLGTVILRILSLIFLGMIILLALNLFLDYRYFDPHEYKTFIFQRGEGLFLPSLITSSYTMLFAFTFPLLIGSLLYGLITFFPNHYKKFKSQELLIIIIFSTIIIFIGGAALGGFIISARYQILLYPLYALLSALLFITLWRKQQKIVIIGLLIIAGLAVIQAKPFYLHYANALDFKETTTIGGWGYGGYELAKKFSSDIPDSSKVVVWADREGFNEFFEGKSYFRGKDNPFTKQVDYLVLSNDGRHIFDRGLRNYRQGGKSFYGYEAANTPLFEYYEKEPLLKFCIHGNPNWCTWIVPVDSADLPVFSTTFSTTE